jgi:hypothetical protein
MRTLKQQIIDFGIEQRKLGNLTLDDSQYDTVLVKFIMQISDDVKTSDYSHAYYRDEDEILHAVWPEMF